MIFALLAATVLMADSTTALQAVPETTNTPPATAAAAEPNAKPKKQANNGLICRTEPTLGTRLPTKKCRTAAQVAEQKQEDQQNLDKMQRIGDPGH